MSVQHKDIPEAGLHELKGASTAVVGYVPVSDGAGSSAWAYPQLVGQGVAPAGSSFFSDGLGGGTWDLTGGALFGVMDYNDNAVATNITAISATAGTVGYKLLSGATLVTPAPLYTQGVVDTIAFENVANNELFRVPQDGVYEISLNASFTGGGGGAGNVYRFNFAINGAEQTVRAYALRQTPSADVGNVNLSNYVLLSAGDTVQPCVANQTAINSPTVISSSFTIILIKSV